MTFNAKLSVSDGLDHLAERLDPIIAAKFPTDLGGHPWTVVLNQLDQIAGRPLRIYSTKDLQAQLKMLTRRLGTSASPSMTTSRPLAPSDASSRSSATPVLTVTRSPDWTLGERTTTASES